MIEFRHNGGIYVFEVRDLLHHLPTDVLKTALRRGKAYSRARRQREREGQGERARALKIDRMIGGDLYADK